MHWRSTVNSGSSAIDRQDRSVRKTWRERFTRREQENGGVAVDSEGKTPSFHRDDAGGTRLQHLQFGSGKKADLLKPLDTASVTIQMYDGCNFASLEKIDWYGVEDHCIGIRMDHRNHLLPVKLVTVQNRSHRSDQKTEVDRTPLLYLRLNLKQVNCSNRQPRNQPNRRSNYDNKT